MAEEFFDPLLRFFSPGYKAEERSKEQLNSSGLRSKVYGLENNQKEIAQLLNAARARTNAYDENYANQGRAGSIQALEALYNDPNTRGALLQGAKQQGLLAKQVGGALGGTQSGATQAASLAAGADGAAQVNNAVGQQSLQDYLQRQQLNAKGASQLRGRDQNVYQGFSKSGFEKDQQVAALDQFYKNNVSRIKNTQRQASTDYNVAARRLQGELIMQDVRNQQAVVQAAGSLVATLT